MHHSEREPLNTDILNKIRSMAGHEPLGATGQFPNGKLVDHDEGEIRFAVGSDPDKAVVLLDFGKSLRSVGMSPQQAIDVAQSLIKHARAVAKEPIRVVIE